MALEYKPRDVQDCPIVSERCKASTPGCSGRTFQCLRKASENGWCWQHDPKRREQRAAQMAEAAPHDPGNIVMGLEMRRRQVEELRAACEAVLADGFREVDMQSWAAPLVRQLRAALAHSQP